MVFLDSQERNFVKALYSFVLCVENMHTFGSSQHSIIQLKKEGFFIEDGWLDNPSVLIMSRVGWINISSWKFSCWSNVWKSNACTLVPKKFQVWEERKITLMRDIEWKNNVGNFLIHLLVTLRNHETNMQKRRNKRCSSYVGGIICRCSVHVFFNWFLDHTNDPSLKARGERQSKKLRYEW